MRHALSAAHGGPGVAPDRTDPAVPIPRTQPAARRRRAGGRRLIDGVQLAAEIHASGRPVTLAVGDHTRVPRRYRGRDIYAWMDAAGVLDDPVLDGRSIEAARRQPSLQLSGRPDMCDLDLGALMRRGIRLVGRLSNIDGLRIGFTGDLGWTAARSHARMLRLLNRIDRSNEHLGLSAPAADPAVRAPVLARSTPIVLDLARERIRSIVWATGYVRRYPWLKLPALDARGEIVHKGGVTALPGLYALGLPFMRRRRSSLISGCGLDAEELASVVHAYLGGALQRAA